MTFPTLFTTSRRALATLAVGLPLAVASVASHAADVSRMDILSLFELQQMDRDHDRMVSKQEFMDMMSKAWDMESSRHPAASKAGMTLDEYRAFARMFGLNVGG